MISIVYYLCPIAFIQALWSPSLSMHSLLVCRLYLQFNRTQDSKYATREKTSAPYQKNHHWYFLTSPLWYIWIDSCACRINLRWAMGFILASFLHFLCWVSSAKEETKRSVFFCSSFLKGTFGLSFDMVNLRWRFSGWGFEPSFF